MRAYSRGNERKARAPADSYDVEGEGVKTPSNRENVYLRGCGQGAEDHATGDSPRRAPLESPPTDKGTRKEPDNRPASSVSPPPSG